MSVERCLDVEGQGVLPALLTGEWYGLLLNGAICSSTFTCASEYATAFNSHSLDSAELHCVSVFKQKLKNGFVVAAFKFFGVFLFVTSIWCLMTV